MPAIQPSTDRRTHFRTCPLCEATCGLAVEVQGDRVVRVRGDEADVFSRGFICPKGANLGALHHDPDRLRRPLVRKDGELQEASWDEAFTAIAEGMGRVFAEHGRESLALLLGNPITHHLAPALYVGPLVRACATRQLYSASTVDQMPMHVVAGLVWGDPAVFPLPDIDRTDHLLMLGANPMASNGSLVTTPDFPGRLKEMPARGARLVVVDPRRTETAARADLYLAIRPGTDVFWLAALVNVLFEERLVDIGRLEPWVEGVDTIRALVAPMTPERVAPICGIDADVTRREARDLAGAASAAVYGRMGNHTVEFGTATAWMAAVLNILTGNFDRPGGVMTSSPIASRIEDGEPGGKGYRTGRWKSRVNGHPEVNGEFPAASLADEMETAGAGQIRAALTVATNPVRSYPNSARLDRAFADLDYYVAFDIYVNETTRHADVILPAPSALEEECYELTFMGNATRSFAKYDDPVFPGEGPSEADLFARLILALRGEGGDADPNVLHQELIDHAIGRIEDQDGVAREKIERALEGKPPIQQLLDLRLRSGWQGDLFGARPGGVTLDKLKEHEHGVDLGPMVERFPARLKTPSARFDLAAPPLVEDWARVRARFDAPADPDSLLLIGRRHVRSNNTWMHNLEPLVTGRSRCTLMMHPGDAAARGLATGDVTSIRARTGALDVEVEVTDDMMPGVVSLPHGWGHDVDGVRTKVALAHAGVGSNHLTDDRIIDPLSGNAVLNGIPVEVAARS
jgi:anaerobic selenocysteine-containing dehydrogenase